MAFLVCYSNSIDDHTARDKAVYVDHSFYKLIFRNCRRETSGYNVLRRIANLRYKGPAILIATEQLTTLVSELEALEDANLTHPQIHEFKSVCQNATDRQTNLTISGDMYPELKGWLAD